MVEWETPLELDCLFETMSLGNAFITTHAKRHLQLALVPNSNFFPCLQLTPMFEGRERPS